MGYTSIITDDMEKETRRHGRSDFQFEYYYDNINKINRDYKEGHWHSEFEFCSVDNDFTKCVIGSEVIELEKNDAIFINSGVTHRFESNQDSMMPLILFNPDFIAGKNTSIYQNNILPVLSSSCKYIIFRRNSIWQRQIIDTLSEIYEESLSKHILKELRIQTLVCSLWITLFTNKHDTFIIPETSGSALVQSRLHMMLSYIHDNYSNKISLDEIANSANISKSEALRCFHSGMKTTPVNYMIEYRLNRACDLLMSTNLSITDISGEVGFTNVSYFTQMFAKYYGASPRVYRNGTVR